MIKFLEFLVVLSVIFFFQLLPFRLNLWISRIIALLMYKIFSKRRKLVEENLRYAFPEHSEEWVKKIARKNFIHTARLAAEMVVLNRLKKDSFLKRWVEFKPSREEYTKLVKEGGICILGHMGSWEWNGRIASILAGEDIYTFAKQQSNPWINRSIEKKRNQAGMQILYLDGSILKAISLVRKRKALAFISDQYAPNGEYIPFMNRLASTFLGPAFFAGPLSPPVHFLSSYRNEQGKLVFEFEKVKLPQGISFKESKEEWSKLFTFNWIQILEKKIKAHPEDYFWIHNRWKNQPENAHEVWQNWNHFISRSEKDLMTT